MSEESARHDRSDVTGTRRTILRSFGGLVSLGGVSGVVSASKGQQSEYNGLYEFPSVVDEYERYQSRGQVDRARDLLDENNIGYGYTSAVPVETEEGIKSQTTNSGGPYAQDSSSVAPQDLWEKSSASISINTTKIGEESVDGYSGKLPRFRVRLDLTLTNGNVVTPQTAGPKDVPAISFEGSHWLTQTQSSSRPPGSIGEGGGVESSSMKSDHFRWRFNEPRAPFVDNGFVHFFSGEMHMHPNAEGISQVFGNYSHAWNNSTGVTINNIFIGLGVFSIGTNFAADNWEISTDSLNVTP